METTDKSILNKSLFNLYKRIKEREQRSALSFKELMALANDRPRILFRNIFQTFSDMFYSYFGDGMDEYRNDPESIRFICYNCASLFEEGTDHPFFADRLFANRLMKHVASFRRVSRQNWIYIFEGPHGSGKSTFLNNLLLKFEQYTRTEAGASYETVWRLNRKDFGGDDSNTQYLLSQLRSAGVSGGMTEQESEMLHLTGKEYLEVPCPSHDHPLLLIPKSYRREIFDELILDEPFKRELFSEKQYEWFFRDSPCTICTSMYQALLDLFDSPDKVYEMIFARRYNFNRRLGQGISVFNPGDGVTKNNVMTNQLLQSQLNDLFKDSNKVKYLYSRYAHTNNGIYSLMDIKAHNKERLANLHGIISEGVHKVEDIEENVNSLFLATMNPEDRANISDTQSFADRITYVKVSYVLDYETELKIYRNMFGEQIYNYFLPKVLENFAKVIISTRLEHRSDSLREWIGDPGRYYLYCDRNLHLLKMDIYAGITPDWLTEEDRKNFTAERRKKIIAESDTEGDKGITGRDSLKIFNDFFSTHAHSDQLITMAMVCDFFKKLHPAGATWAIPTGFLESLLNLYNYTVLQEVKEALYFYNEDRISREIKNYLFAVNFDPGRTEKCIFTGEEIDITEEFFNGVESRILGASSSLIQRNIFRKDTQKQYTSRTLTQEILVEGKSITETAVYKSLYQRYVHNLKENVLDPFLKNDNFRNAVKSYGSDTFKTYDKRIREDVVLLMENLKRKYGYTEQGAREVCLYVIDSNLASTFSRRLV